MSEFSAQWLSCREPVDHAARSEAVLSAMAHYFIHKTELRITDIGCGTGSILRVLRPYFYQKISWHLIDNDDALLAHAKNTLQGDEMSFSLADLSRSLDPVFKLDADLVTTSAFLDLVSENWLKGFVAEVTRREIPFYAALTYDGRSGCTPAHDQDAKILSSFNRHQHKDKGLGPALGPDAAEASLGLFQEAGYEIVSERSDWAANGNHIEFQTMLVEGWHQAACEIDPSGRKDFDAWLEFRKDALSTGNHVVHVGHVDFFAAPK